MNDTKNIKMIKGKIANAAINYALEKNLEWFYIIMPDSSDPKVDGICFVKAGSEEFMNNKAKFFGKTWMLDMKDWNSYGLRVAVEKFMNIPLTFISDDYEG